MHTPDVTTSETAWKAVSILSGLVAAVAGQWVIRGAWKTWTQDDPPANPADPETDLRHAVLWSAMTGAALGVARMAARRGAAEVWETRTGTPPPQLRQSA